MEYEPMMDVGEPQSLKRSAADMADEYSTPDKKLKLEKLSEDEALDEDPFLSKNLALCPASPSPASPLTTTPASPLTTTPASPTEPPPGISSTPMSPVDWPAENEDDRLGEEECNGSVDEEEEEEDEYEMREFSVLDDVEPSDEEEMADTDLSDSDFVDEDEIEQMLDDDFQKRKPTEFILKEKVVLMENDHDPFDILPQDWIMVTHNSGMNVYLHKPTRVCTMSRPYFLGPASVRKHDVPISAIPCLQYRRKMEAQAKCPMNGGTDSANDDVKNHKVAASPASQSDPGVTTNHEESIASERPCSAPPAAQSAATCLPSQGSDPNVRITTVAEHKRKALDYLQLREYCEQLFEFHTVKVKRFRTWRARRKHNRRTLRPSLPDGTKILTVPIPPAPNRPNAHLRRKQFILNPKNKSEICILHEYAQHALRCQPNYVYKETANAEKPFCATITINDIIYGVGYAQNKKQAKLEAAKQTLQILIPGIIENKDEEDKLKDDLSFFDTIPPEDVRVPDLCNKTGQAAPFEILQECLKRNFGLGDTKISSDIKMSNGRQKGEYTMKIAKFEAKVMCKNKREGKQKAAQNILHQMHPFINNWGSILRLYTKDIKAVHEKKAQRLSITTLLGKAFEPNHTILNKLKDEMRKLKTQQDEFQANIKCKIELPSVELKSSVIGNVKLN